MIKFYRADNGIFAEKSFLDAINQATQTIDFCGVGAHFQNGIVERHIQRLTSHARTSLLHAKRYWPSMISTVLWPFALKHAEFVYNNLNVDASGQSPSQKFFSAQNNFDVTSLHPWGALALFLTLDRKWAIRSQNGTPDPGWEFI